MYSYLIIGSGLYGATIAQQFYNAGKKILVIEKRSHIAGNTYTEDIEGIKVHKYGAHIDTCEDFPYDIIDELKKEYEL